MNAVRRLPGINRQTGLFLLHSAVFQFGLFGITDVVLNFYFVSLGYDPQTIGVLQGLSRLGGMFTGIPIGMMANRIGGRRLVVVGMIGCALSYVPMLVAPVLPMLIFGRVIFGMAWSAANIAYPPMMVSLVKREHQTHLFAYYQMVTLTTISIGAALGGVLPSLIVGTVGLPAGAARGDLPAAQTPFAYGAVLSLAAISLILSLWPLLRMRPPGPPVKTALIRAAEQPPAKIPWRLLVELSVPMVLFGFTAGLTYPFYNLFFRVTYHVPDQTVGTILSAGWFVMGLFGLSAPWLDRRIGRLRSLVLAMLIAAVAFGLLSVATALWLGVIVFIMAVSTRNLMVPLYDPLRMEYMPPALYNISSALSSVIWSLGWFLSSVISGTLQQNQGFPFIMQLVAVLMVFTALSLYLAFRGRKPYHDLIAPG